MINYNRLGYEIKRDLTNFSTKISQGLIGLTSSAHSESIYLEKLKECSKRIYEVPGFLT